MNGERWLKLTSVLVNVVQKNLKLECLKVDGKLCMEYWI